MKSVKNVLLSVGILCSTIVFGQNNSIEFGVEGGGSLISLRGDGFVVDKNVNDVGFATGFSFLYHFNDHFSLKTNMFYERKGNEINYFYHELPFDKQDIYIKEKFENKYQLDYLTLPVLARYSFGKQKNFFVNAGGYVGYLLKSTLINNELPKVGRVEKDNTRSFSRLDFGITAGIGGQINLKDNLKLSIELRNSLGLQNIGKIDKENYNEGKGLILKKDGLSTNSTTMLIGLSYHLPKSTKNEKAIE